MTQKINILFLLPNFDTGGSETLVCNIIKGLDPDRFAPVLAVFFTGSYEEDFRKTGYPLYCIHTQGEVCSWPTRISRLHQIVHRHDIDVVNTHHTSALFQGFVPFKLLNRLYLVHTEHNRLDIDAHIKPYHLQIQKRILRYTDVVIGVADGVSRYLREELHVPAERVTTVYNGIDLRRFQLVDFNRRTYRQRIGLSADDIAIGMVGNFREEKNQHLLIRAAHVLKVRGVSVKIVFCGDGSTLQHNKDLAADLGIAEQILFLGARFDIPEVLHCLDLYCLPSRYEGQPISLLEAMAAKLPCIGANVPGINELVHDGDNGFLFVDNDHEALAGCIGRLLENRSVTQSAASRGYEVARVYSTDRMMHRYQHIFSRGAGR